MVIYTYIHTYIHTYHTRNNKKAKRNKTKHLSVIKHGKDDDDDAHIDADWGALVREKKLLLLQNGGTAHLGDRLLVHAENPPG